MDAKEFEAALLRDGFSADIRVVEPNTSNPEHSHPYDVRGLVLEGDITLTTVEGSRTYRPGEVFTMEAGRPHAELFGPQGARNLVGRFTPPA
ncbi:cupin domain-containing protein [Plastoroseomonas arctica]|uniref:Cupin domain-containing protein n=1 Tax=Plastoroseomonas arctica TaxID=1509237 RepID=A0AAF1JYM8_9PROT|nr:cupin domain-containing protein [Plastoroseomonas arctica]MBR0656095.1 cupin domain-containing protein [Plastoroseomonas arctica]